MGNLILDLFLITVIVSFIVDYSGVVDSIKSLISRILTKGAMATSSYRLKPFDCSLCMTFWSGLLYLIITNQFTLVGITLVCIFAALADSIVSIILLIKDSISYIINKISNKIC